MTIQAYEELLADCLIDDTLETLTLSYDLWTDQDTIFQAICYYQFTQLLMDFTAFDHLLIGNEAQLLAARDYLRDNPWDDAGAYFENRIIYRINNNIKLFPEED